MTETMWIPAGNMEGASRFPTLRAALEPSNATVFHSGSMSDPPATLGSSVKTSHIHTPYYDLKRCNQ